MFAAIDAVVDKLYRQINRYRGKRRRKVRGGTGELTMEEPLPIETVEGVDEDRQIVRYKKFPLHPMTADEAIEQMELLGHDFFVFFDIDTDAVNVLYRRHDGDYGVLQPELA
jgi:putative sigma-54 modulation protein